MATSLNNTNTNTWAELVQLYTQSVDPIIFALDFENPHCVASNFKFGRHTNTQAGLAVLDTQKVRNNTDNSFSAVSLITGKENYHLENLSRAMFGATTEHITTHEMLGKITHFVEDHRVPGRPTILIGHNVQVEVKALKGLGFDFTGIDYIFDTYDLAKEQLQLNHRKLIDVVRACGITTSQGNFHTAVNDAALTLGCFLHVLHTKVFQPCDFEISIPLAAYSAKLFQPSYPSPPASPEPYVQQLYYPVPSQVYYDPATGQQYIAVPYFDQSGNVQYACTYTTPPPSPSRAHVPSWYGA